MKLYINSIAHYLPEQVVTNKFYNDLNNLEDGWIESRTGIKERRKTAEGENTRTMAIDAVARCVPNLPYPIEEIDLIIGATYTPFDTIVTLAHGIQNRFEITNAKVITVTSACSSFANAMEIVEGYFAMNKCSKALIVASENNSAYNDESNIKSGHLWGDGAAAVFVSKEKTSASDLEILAVDTTGLGNVGKSIEAVTLQPRTGKTNMPYGKDVYIHATQYLVDAIDNILADNDFRIDDVDYLITHQANMRIIENVRKKLDIDPSKVLSNIDKLGNTGCASTPIVLSQNIDKIKIGDLVCISVFGGGYSSGAILLKK